MAHKSVDEIVEGIPDEMRGKVWHALGLKLREGGVHTNDSGDNGPPPAPPGKPKTNN